jgi:Ran GTPase-activating protein (RanGAP) involved in mRNA processing and transport
LIGQAFVECRNLETLNISDNGVQLTNQRCHDAIQDLIINTKRLKHLIMDDFEINNDEGKNYVDSLHMN